MLLVLTVTTEQQLGSPTTVANVLGRLNNNKEGLAVTHDDLQRPVRVIPENTWKNPGILGFYPGFLPFSACWPLNNSNNSNKQ